MSESYRKRPYETIVDLYRMGQYGLPMVLIFAIMFEINQIYFTEPYKVRTLMLRETRRNSDLSKRHKTPSIMFTQNPIRYWSVRYKNEMLSAKEKEKCKFLLYKTVFILIFQCIILFVWVVCYQMFLYDLYPFLTVTDRVGHFKKVEMSTNREPLKDLYNASIHCHLMPI